MKSLFFWIICMKAGITCNITAAIGLLCRFLKKRISKARYYYFLHKSTKKERGFIYGNITWQWPRKMRIKLKNYSSKSILWNSLTKKSLLPATSTLYRSPMACNTNASLDKLTCTDYVDFGKCQNSFGRLSWCTNDSNYLGVKGEIIKKEDNKEFRRVQRLTMGRQISAKLCDWGISW